MRGFVRHRNNVIAESILADLIVHALHGLEYCEGFEGAVAELLAVQHERRIRLRGLFR